MSDLERELRETIEALVDPEAQPRLLEVLPSLLEGVASWRGPTPKPGQYDVFVAAAAMPGSCTVFAANVWPVYDQEQAAKLSKSDLVRALCDNLTRAPSDEISSNILIALTMLLGLEGVERQKHDARRVRSGGGVPLVVALFNRQDKDVTLLVTTVGVPRPTVH
jgi:hypothetical protein